MTPKISKTHQRVQEAAKRRKKTPSTALYPVDGNNDQWLESITETWDDLNQLRQSLAEAVMNVTMQISEMAINPELQAALHDQKPVFDKLVQTFWNDAQYFASWVADIRSRHEHLTGRFKNLDDYSRYMQLSLEYQNANEELQTLLAPTMSEMVLIAHECIGRQTAQQQEEKAQQDLINPSVVSDLEVKEVIA